jgi:ABC-2 type transport system permease protein
VLAAAIPMDAVFLGKLFAMLGVSLVGVAVWASAGSAIWFASGNAMADYPPPAVGWPLFFLLGTAYFAMGYLLLGSVFLAIGSMATTVREVQTLSMPVTMLQLLNFFYASWAVARPGTWAELGAMIVPFSSPFIMLARAAREEALTPHLLALGWQALCVMVCVKVGATLFRRWVMKSGPQGTRSKGGLLARLRRARA